MRFAVVMLILAVGLALLLINHDAGEVFGLETGDFARAVMLSAVFVSITSGLVWRHRERLPTALKAMGIWLLIGLALIVGYGFRDDVGRLGWQTLAVLVPGTPVEGPEAGSVTVRKARDGHFSVRAEINGKPVRLIVDTGASSVVLTDRAARDAGIDTTTLLYDAKISTANGLTTAAPVVLDSVTIGDITETRVRALVARPGQLQTSLLGNTFLDRLASFTVEGDRLTMRR
jgi:aspartyl protease family protein